MNAFYEFFFMNCNFYEKKFYVMSFYEMRVCQYIIYPQETHAIEDGNLKTENVC